MFIFSVLLCSSNYSRLCMSCYFCVVWVWHQWLH